MEKFFYRVKKGDTLLNVGQKFNVSVLVAIKQNNIKEEICEGDLLYLKKCKKPYLVGAGEDIFSVAKKCNVNVEKLKELNANPPYIFYGIVLETQD